MRDRKGKKSLSINYTFKYDVVVVTEFLPLQLVVQVFWQLVSFDSE